MVFNTIFNITCISVIWHQPVHQYMISWSYFSQLFFSSHWLLSHIIIVETMVRCETGMNSVKITIINPQIGQAGDHFCELLFSCLVPTEPHHIFCKCNQPLFRERSPYVLSPFIQRISLTLYLIFQF